MAKLSYSAIEPPIPVEAAIHTMSAYCAVVGWSTVGGNTIRPGACFTPLPIAYYQ
jgi:hypothetical protein